jgi:hypothetical protein
MTLIRTLLTVLLLALPSAAAWTREQKGWALGTAGILRQMGTAQHDVIFWTEQSPAAEREARSLLASWWGASYEAELLSTIDSLLKDEGDVHIVWSIRAQSMWRDGVWRDALSEDEA